MRAYLYYSKNKIAKLNKVEKIKQGVSKAVNSAFDLFIGLDASDVFINCVKISNDIDVFLVLDAEIEGEPAKLVNSMTRIKSDVIELVREDQDSPALELKVRSKIDPKHAPILASEDEEKEIEKKEETSGEESEIDYEKRSKQYIPVEPSYSFDRVILPKDVIEKLEEALSILQYERKVFEEWGLYEIQPHPSSSLSFFGPSGTGKTMAAEAVAQKLGKKILKVGYADVESKYHGEGPKMIKAIFLAAEKNDAVLFFDEADSLLSKRLTNVSQGSEQAINSMRSQLLICLEEFKGIVIFATNLVINYDSAFLTRLISIEFKNPDVETRKKIWDVHIRPANDSKQHKLNIPLDSDVDTMNLAEKYSFSGREIRNAVISACVSVAMAGKEIVCQNDFVKACEKIVKERESVSNAGDHTVDDRGKEALKKAFIDKIKEQEQLKKESLSDTENKKEEQ